MEYLWQLDSQETIFHTSMQLSFIGQCSFSCYKALAILKNRFHLSLSLSHSLSLSLSLFFYLFAYFCLCLVSECYLSDRAHVRMFSGLYVSPSASFTFFKMTVSGRISIIWLEHHSDLLAPSRVATIHQKAIFHLHKTQIEPLPFCPIQYFSPLLDLIIIKNQITLYTWPSLCTLLNLHSVQFLEGFHCLKVTAVLFNF